RLVQDMSHLRQCIAIGDVHAHQPHVGIFQQMRLRVIYGRIVHGAVIESRFENGAEASSPRAVVEISGEILAIAAPGQIAVDLAMRIPPAVPAQKRFKRILQKPAVMKFAIESEYRDCAYRWFRPIETFPSAGTVVVGYESFGCFAAQGFNGVGVGKIAIADARHGGGKKRIPVEDDIAAPIHTPNAAHRRSNAVVSWFVNGVPAEGGFDRVHDGRGSAARYRFLVGLALRVDSRFNFGQRAAPASAHAHGRRKVGGEIWPSNWNVE